MLFQEFSKYLERIEKTASRNEMTVILAELVNKISTAEAREAAYLLQGRVAPVFEPIEFNVAEKMMIKALLVTFNLEKSDIQKEFRGVGDLGIVAEKYRELSNLPIKKIDIEEVFKRLHDLAMFSGPGSMDKKILALKSLFLDLPPLSCRYVARIPIGKLRLGLSAKTILDVLSWAKAGNKSLRPEIDRAYYACSDLGFVMETFKQSGMEGLARLESQPGIPVFSKLVERIPTTKKIIEKMGLVWAQPKFDGLRCQIHLWEENGIRKVKLFSRNLEDLTAMFPDVVTAISKIRAQSVILDSEIIGFNKETEEFMPFQKTMYRRRKYRIGEKAKEIPVYIFVFDFLHLDGKNLMRFSIEDRLKKLKDLLKSETNSIQITETRLFDNARELDKYFIENVSEGLEGIIVKKKGSIYEPGTRNFDWVKLKRAMQGHLSDTVDAVIMGYYAGKGRLAKFGIGAILIGVLDEEKDELVTIAKVGTGITDDQWKQLKNILKNIEVDKKPVRYNVNKLLKPDYWVEPMVVSQIRADEITRSPVHTCAMDKDGIGYALRFPRMEVIKRDKLPEDSTTIVEILKMYKNQLVPK